MSIQEKQKNKRIILLDAHAIIHRAYHALPDFATAKGEPTGALYGISIMMIKIIEDLKPDYIIACYDVHAPTYRHEVYKEYKLGRKKADDALIIQLEKSRDIFKAFNIPIYEKAGFEADDILGTIVSQMADKDFEIIIASGDMDTMQLISGEKVKVYTLKKGIKDTIMYDEKAVMERFSFGPKLIPDYKGLRGDPSDNIVGVKGIGEKTATILITTFGTIENIYHELEAGHEDSFSKAGISPRIIQLLKDNKEEAEFSKMLATIRRDAPIKFELPEKTFKEAVDLTKIKTLWNELEFRTLGQRFEKLMTTNATMFNVDLNESTKKKVKGKDLENDSPNDESGSDSNNAKSNKKADDIKTAKYGNIPEDEFKKTALALWLVNSNLTEATMDDILNFGNASDFKQAKENIYAELKKRNLTKVYEEIELPLFPVIKAMNDRGIRVDRAVLKDLSVRYHSELSRLEKSIWGNAGGEFNISSPKQLGEVIFDKLGLTAKNMKKTAGGARSTRESELEKLRDAHPMIPMIFEYRELAKLLSTYIDAIPPLLDPNDRLHSTLISSGTTTGRMASKDPNLQNIPIKSDLGRAIRGAFIAHKGFKLVAFDYSQMELRIAAFLSGDEKLISIFKEGKDVHTSVASFVFKVPEDKVTSDMRRQAKVINFGIIYGMGVLALKQNLGTTRDEAQKFLNDYFTTFSTLASYLDSVKKETALRGYTETFFGRRRYFEGINSKLPFIKAAAERMAINAPIQGTEADVIKLAMIRIFDYIKKDKLEADVFPLLQVHDELIYEVKAEKAEEVSKEIEKIMESIMDKKDTQGITLTAKAAVGDNWGELK